jgi:hypothetical protein
MRRQAHMPGKKNWLFAGSETGAQTLARAMTLIETARMNGLDPQAYITDLLNRIHNQKQQDRRIAGLELAAADRPASAGRLVAAITCISNLDCVAAMLLAESLNDPEVAGRLKTKEDNRTITLIPKPRPLHRPSLDQGRILILLGEESRGHVKPWQIHMTRLVTLSSTYQVSKDWCGCPYS